MRTENQEPIRTKTREQFSPRDGLQFPYTHRRYIIFKAQPMRFKRDAADRSQKLNARDLGRKAARHLLADGMQLNILGTDENLNFLPLEQVARGIRRNDQILEGDMPDGRVNLRGEMRRTSDEARDKR